MSLAYLLEFDKARNRSWVFGESFEVRAEIIEFKPQNSPLGHPYHAGYYCVVQSSELLNERNEFVHGIAATRRRRSARVTAWL